MIGRQVIVQDVALLRANGKNIFSTNRGYLIQEDEETTRVFKVQHEDDEVEKELTTIVDLGGTVEDVFVYHKVYGVLRAEIEVSGNVTKENIARLTGLGVDYVSSGALTHSAPILDISLKNLHAV